MGEIGTDRATCEKGSDTRITDDAQQQAISDSGAGE